MLCTKSVDYSVYVINWMNMFIYVRYQAIVLYTFSMVIIAQGMNTHTHEHTNTSDGAYRLLLHKYYRISSDVSSLTIGQWWLHTIVAMLADTESRLPCYYNSC